MTTAQAWTPSSWRSLRARHQPEWPDESHVEASREQLAALPPLVFAGEARALTAALADVSAGRAFLLQAGDCAESFKDFSAPAIRERLKIFLQMAAVLTWGATLPVVKVGRIAGQFGKPRSSPREQVGELDLPSFLGHMVNDEAPTAEARTPDPERMLRVYHQSAATLNLLRAFTKGGFADLQQVHAWNQEFARESKEGQRYERIAAEIERALRFMAACGIDISGRHELHEVDLWTSHEGLLLDYEEPLDAARFSDRRLVRLLRAHALDRRAHAPARRRACRLLLGVHNPIGIKLGPAAAPEDVLELCELLNPGRVAGRLTLITRMGVERVAELLPPLLRAARDSGHAVVWVCDPMHANTITTASGRKTRRFDDVMGEIEAFFSAHRAEGTWPGGVHLEFTGDDVTECIGGAEAVLEEQLDGRYMTLCDPRLNARQSLDLAFRVAELMRA